jgi:hypothetical protein
MLGAGREASLSGGGGDMGAPTSWGWERGVEIGAVLFGERAPSIYPLTIKWPIP